MSKLSTRAEIIKLARLLKLEVGQLEFLERFEITQIRALRERMSGTLFDGSKATLVRVAAASKLIPVGLVAVIGQKIYGPLLCARVTGLLPPARAVEIAMKLSPHFLADLSMELDPRSAREVLALLPAERVIAVAQELIQRREYITMARFADFLSDLTIRRVMDTIKDDRALLEIAFFIESRARLETIIGMMPPERLRKIIVTAATDEKGLWPEALAMMTQVSPELRGRMGDLTAELDDDILASAIAVIDRDGLWPAWVEVLSAMNATSQRRMLSMGAVETPERLAAFAAAAKDHGLWNQFLPLLKFMNDAPRKQLEDLVERIKSTVKNMG
jgi:hypothetical protein